MSCYFQAGELDLWNPSNSVARLFIEQSKTLARIVGTEPGLGPIIEDECEIDPEGFSDFVSALLAAYQRSNNGALKSMMAGVLGISLVLLERGDWQVSNSVEDVTAAWEDRMKTLSRSMPRG
jgi:hypothetical protein